MKWNTHYILNKKGEPVEEPDTGKWCAWYEATINNDKRIVKRERFAGITISTVFLGLDHNWGKGPPILWETMTFSKKTEFDCKQMRCSGSREQAEAMHQRMVEEVKKELHELGRRKTTKHNR